MNRLLNKILQLRPKFYILFFLLPFFPALTQKVVDKSSSAVKSEKENVFVSLDRNSTFKNPKLETIENVVVSDNDQMQVRQHLLMSLDLLIKSARVIQKEKGSYPNAMGRLPDIMGMLDSLYLIRTPFVGARKFSIEVQGERSRSGDALREIVQNDRLTIDQDFKINSNFPLPLPPRDYLHVLAQSIMNKAVQNGFNLPNVRDLQYMEGIFSGYFRYEVRNLATDQSAGFLISHDGKSKTLVKGRTLVAIGLKEPVKNEVIELGSEKSLFEWVLEAKQMAFLEQSAKEELEKLYLAQKIEQEISGHYSTHFESLSPWWSSLSSLGSRNSFFELEELQADPTYGFSSELRCNERLVNPIFKQLCDIHEDKLWTINGFGQFSVYSQSKEAIGKITEMNDSLDRNLQSRHKDSRGVAGE